MSGWGDLMKLSDRFWSKVDDRGSGCWTWLAAKNPKGYGRFSVRRRAYQAHRVAYELSVGPIPDGMMLDHLCRNRACVNPAHLEPVTNRINLLRGDTLPAANVAKTECRNGHGLTPDNTVTYPSGERRCKTCDRDKQRRYYWERKRLALAGKEPTA